MLFMTYDDQPALRCAICDKPILSASQAVVVYPRGIGPGQMHRVCLTHMGQCQLQGQSNVENDFGPGLVMTLTEYGDRLRHSPKDADSPHWSQKQNWAGRGV